jgi:hypothetical protein
MNYAVIDGIIGFLIGLACIGIPQLVHKLRQRPDDDDTKAYLKETGRSVQDIVQENAAVESQQESETQSQKPGG